MTRNLSADADQSCLMPTYARLPVAFERGAGVWLYDTQGKAYLDALTGIAVCGLGHAHEGVREAVAKQAATLLHTSNLYEIELQARLARRLCDLSGMDSVFFCNSGAEANEAAIKIARLYGHGLKVDNPLILVMRGAFHGRTLATLTATANRKIQAGFEPLMPGFVRTDFGDMDAVRATTRNTKHIVAVLLEPIQGESGVYQPPRGYLEAMRKHCDEHGWLLMLDEVQTGNARTGKYFAFQHEDVLPDVLTTAKGLGNGVPIGACLAAGKAAQVFGPGAHGSTFGGNLLACAAAHAVLDAVHDEGLESRAAELGARIRGGLERAIEGSNRIPPVREIRGRGLMLGIELAEPVTGVVSSAMKHGLLINCIGDRVIRILPVLTMTDDEADELVIRLVKTLESLRSAGVES